MKVQKVYEQLAALDDFERQKANIIASGNYEGNNYEMSVRGIHVCDGGLKVVLAVDISSDLQDDMEEGINEELRDEIEEETKKEAVHELHGFITDNTANAEKLLSLLTGYLNAKEEEREPHELALLRFLKKGILCPSSTSTFSAAQARRPKASVAPASAADRQLTGEDKERLRKLLETAYSNPQ
jgi:hypothetical protein